MVASASCLWCAALPPPWAERVTAAELPAYSAAMRLGVLSLMLMVVLTVQGCTVATGVYHAMQRVVPFSTSGGVESGAVTVRKGDTVYAIARRTNVSMRALIEANGLRPPYLLQIGQTLRLPAAMTHKVAKGDTLYDISRNYGVDMASLARANGLRSPYLIYPGQSLRLPSGASAPRAVAVAKAPAPAASPSRTASASKPTKTAAAAAASSKPVPAPAPRAARRFLWPVEGKVVSGFGPKGSGKHNDGINIAAAKGTPVRAAENGVVVYAGDRLKGFGNLLLVKHADGWMTAYAHNRVLKVARGDVVTRGQIIAEVGRTGSVTTPQLHFEVRQGKRAVDPVSYLDRAGS